MIVSVMTSPASNERPPARSPRPRLALAIGPDERAAFLDGLLARLERVAEVVDGGISIERIGRQAPEILITGWSTPWLEPVLCRADNRIRYICHLTGSVRNAVPRAFLEGGGLVTNWGSLANTAVAEHALLLALAAMRSLPQWPSVIAGEMQTPPTRALRTQTLGGRRVGIHGFGGVAQALVKLLQPFTDSIICYSAGVPADFVRMRGAEPVASLAELFGRSEVLFECEALTPATRQCVSARELARLADDAVFVNVARGDLVDEEALIQEALSGRIRVAVDVVTSEPLTRASAIAQLSNVVLSPHIAGPTLDQYPRIGALAVANVERYVAGAPLQFEITPEIFDRST